MLGPVTDWLYRCCRRTPSSSQLHRGKSTVYFQKSSLLLKYCQPEKGRASFEMGQHLQTVRDTSQGLRNDCPCLKNSCTCLRNGCPCLRNGCPCLRNGCPCLRNDCMSLCITCLLWLMMKLHASFPNVSYSGTQTIEYMPSASLVTTHCNKAKAELWSHSKTGQTLIRSTVSCRG